MQILILQYEVFGLHKACANPPNNALRRALSVFAITKRLYSDDTATAGMRFSTGASDQSNVDLPHRILFIARGVAYLKLCESERLRHNEINVPIYGFGVVDKQGLPS